MDQIRKAVPLPSSNAPNNCLPVVASQNHGDDSSPVGSLIPIGTVRSGDLTLSEVESDPPMIAAKKMSPGSNQMPLSTNRKSLQETRALISE